MTVEPDRVVDSSTELEPVTGRELLMLQGITKRWGTQLILDDVDLSVHAGSLVSLAGANGVGKTTLLRIACGLIKAEAGSVQLDGLDPDRERRAFARRIAFMSAGDRGLYARLTVRQNLDYAAGIALLRRDRRQRAIEQALDRWDLRALERHRVDRMSMGQRQRARLALTMLHEPDVILLDEPTNSLDPQGVELLSVAVRSVLARGGSVVWCSPTGDTGGLDPRAGYLVRDTKLVPR